MKVIDTHSGKQVLLGEEIRSPDGESITVLELRTGLLNASARLRISSAREAQREVWVPLQVRWTHPDFFFQHVAFLPT